MKRIPSFLFRNFDVMVNGDDKIGQVAECETPELKRKDEKILNAGMIKERQVALAIEVGMLKLKFTAFDPSMFGLFDSGIGPDREIVLTGWAPDDDGTSHAVFVRVLGKLHTSKADKLEVGKKHTIDFEFTVNQYLLQIDNKEIIYIDDFSLRANGVDQFSAMNQALARTGATQ